MKVQEQLKEAYQQLRTQYLNNTPQLLETARSLISTYLALVANQQKVKTLIAKNTTTLLSIGQLGVSYCEKIKRSTNKKTEQPLDLNHSVLLLMSDSGLLEMIIMDQRPAKFNKGLIDSSGGCKSYKPAIKISEPFTEQCIASYKPVLIEICNRSFEGRRVPLAPSLFQKAESSHSNARLLRQKKDGAFVLYQEHSIDKLKFDLMIVFQQLAQMDRTNNKTRGSDKLSFLLLNTAKALHQFHRTHKRPHGDIKCENFLMDEHANISIIDEAPANVFSLGILNLTPYLTPPEAHADSIAAADTFCLSLCLLQFIFDSLLNSPTMDQQSEVIFEHLQSLYRAHMEIDLPASTTHEERQAFISSMQKKQLIFIQRLEQEFANLIPYISTSSPLMGKILVILHKMLHSQASQRIQLPELIGYLTSLYASINTTAADKPQPSLQLSLFNANTAENKHHSKPNQEEKTKVVANLIRNNPLG